MRQVLLVLELRLETLLHLRRGRSTGAAIRLGKDVIVGVVGSVVPARPQAKKPAEPSQNKAVANG
jgi:hypothetical protein